MAAPTATATASSSASNGMDTSFPNPVDGSPQQKERHSLSLDQRRALRRWANSQTVRPSHKACIEWFTSQYGQSISQSTVSHSLSPKYARLDGDPQLSGSRLRFGNWPDVEKLVLMWHHSMVNSGRQPTNEELADKAKSIFQQLPRYKDEPAPEFSPGWIHRFKKRYGLLIRRQRRHSTAPPPQDDIPYLVDTVPRFMSISSETSPAAIREAINRIVGVEPSLATCARVRDEVVRRLENPHLNHNGQPNHSGHGGDPDSGMSNPGSGPVPAPAPAAASGDAYGDDPELILQNALHALQQEEADAEAEAAVIREERDRSERGLPPLGALGASQSYAQQAAGAALATPVRSNGVGQPPGSSGGPGGAGAGGGSGESGGGGGGGVGGVGAVPNGVLTQPRYSVGEDLNLTPIPSNGPISSTDRPMRCPFCINQRMLRTIKEAVEHMSTHVIV